MTKDTIFTWRPFYKELAHALLQYRDKQQELINIYVEIGKTLVEKQQQEKKFGSGKILLMDRETEDGSGTLFTEIDPFTFFSHFNKSSNQNKEVKKLITRTLKEKLNLQSDIPTDFYGIPTMQALNFLFFPFKYKRGKNDISILWDLFEQALPNQIKEDTFNKALAIQQIGVAKLTGGLFWVNNDDFLNLDAPITTYLKNEYKIEINTTEYTFNDYKRDMELVKEKTNRLPFYELSHKAWLNGEPEPLNVIYYGPPGTGKTFALKNKRDEFTSDGKKRYRFVTFHQSYSYEDFIEGIKPVINDEGDGGGDKTISYEISDGIFKDIAREAANDKNEKYAIFIDEINRGNVASIFGELITLIEEDKRGFEVTLPYSKEKFAVPENLYIYASMNTVDKSIESLDAAFRRRFSFVPCYPDATTIIENYGGVNLRKILVSINLRLEILLDKDHQIGHSYFMEIKDRRDNLKALQSLFENKIIPLLEEYFLNDYSKITMVLGKSFFTKEKVDYKKILKDIDPSFDADEDKYSYDLKIPDTLEGFKSIYDDSLSENSSHE